MRNIDLSNVRHVDYEALNTAHGSELVQSYFCPKRH